MDEKNTDLFDECMRLYTNFRYERSFTMAAGWQLVATGAAGGEPVRFTFESTSIAEDDTDTIASIERGVLQSFVSTAGKLVPVTVTELRDRAPTYEEIEGRRALMLDDGRVAVAAWYPQMGGYCARCWVITGRAEQDTGSSCFEALVWHDGEFPFDATSDKPPARLHHCDPQQFRDFAQLVIDAQDGNS